MADDKVDSTLDDARAAYESLNTPEPAPIVPAAEPTAEPTETAQQVADRTRDEQGRFAKGEKPRETLKLKEKPLAPVAPTAPAPVSPIASGEPAAPLDAKPIVEKISAPQEWGGLAKVKWDRLPVDVQKEIASHETARAAAVADLVPVSELLNVNKEFLVNQAGSLPAAMTELMQLAKMSVDDPVRLIQTIAARRGIDLRAFSGGQPPAAAQQQPQDVASLLAQLVDQRIQPILAEREQQQTQQLQTTISTFGADPKHPFFNDVRVHMGQLIQAGAAKTMDEAYEQATWANPTIRAHLLDEQREATEKARAAEVSKAKAAVRTSVTGSPLPGAAGLNGRGDPKANALDDVRAAYAELSGG